EARVRRPWAVPRQDFLPDVPWHVTGSLLELDLALAPLTLQDPGPDRRVEAPRVAPHEREAFAVGRSLMQVSRLSDQDRDAIAGAIAAGRERVRALAFDPREERAIGGALEFDGWRRRELRWTLEHQADRVESLFSLADLVALGGGVARV